MFRWDESKFSRHFSHDAHGPLRWGAAKHLTFMATASVTKSLRWTFDLADARVGVEALLFGTSVSYLVRLSSQLVWSSASMARIGIKWSVITDEPAVVAVIGLSILTGSPLVAIANALSLPSARAIVQNKQTLAPHWLINCFRDQNDPDRGQRRINLPSPNVPAEQTNPAVKQTIFEHWSAHRDTSQWHRIAT